METTETQTQPAVPQPSGSAVVAAFNKLAAELPAEESTTEDPAPVEAQPPASISIPIERVPEKFRTNPNALPDAYVNAERFGTSKAQEAAQLRRELDAANARLAAAEQVNRMSPQPVAPQPNLSEMVITETPRFVEAVQQESARIARQAAQEESQRAIGALRQEQQNKDQAQALIGAFEAAKGMARDQGYKFTDAEWREKIQYVAPAVLREADNEKNPNAVYDPKRYLNHVQKLSGAPPKATIPSEANPPVAARAALAQTTQDTPTLSREAQQVNKRIRQALKLPD